MVALNYNAPSTRNLSYDCISSINELGYKRSKTSFGCLNVKC